MNSKLVFAKLFLVEPAKWIMIGLGYLPLGITSEDLEALNVFENGAVLVFATIGFLHLIIFLISLSLEGVAWLVATSSGVTAMVSEGIALIIIIKGQPDND